MELENIHIEKLLKVKIFMFQKIYCTSKTIILSDTKRSRVDEDSEEEVVKHPALATKKTSTPVILAPVSNTIKIIKIILKFLEQTASKTKTLQTTDCSASCSVLTTTWSFVSKENSIK